MDNAKKTAEDTALRDDVLYKEQWITSDDGTKLFIRCWIPHGKVRAVLHIVHGMSEHSGRYEKTATSLVADGVAVWSADMRGHGKTADVSINDPGKGGLMGHCSDHSAIPLVISDIDIINHTIIKTYPETPLFLFGHSWGSFLTQMYIETYTGMPLGGCILSGTRGPDGLKVAISKSVMAFIAALRGIREPSKLSYALSIGPFNLPFKPNRTKFDWLSRDSKEVDAYIADALSGNLPSAGFFRDLAILLNTIHKKELMERIRQDLPVYVFCGNADPVGDMGKSPTALINAYRALGVKDLEFTLYPGARHELLNEINREEAIENLRNWICQHIKQRSIE
jgi:alpha-beta hydrolase superfamily lysophospholipase